MEFLMTYGWAILVVLISIGAMYYFGMLDFMGMVPSMCTLGPGLSCDDFIITEDAVKLVVRNGMGSNIMIEISLLKAALARQSRISLSLQTDRWDIYNRFMRD